MSCRNP